MKWGLPVLAVLAAVAAGGVLAAELSPGDALRPIVVQPFSALPTGEGRPPGWKEYRFTKARKDTDYSLVTDDGTTVLRADARSGGSPPGSSKRSWVFLHLPSRMWL